MKIQDLALAAAELAELKGWPEVKAVSIARALCVNPVSVARSASIKDIKAAAEKVVNAHKMRYPRAAIELRIGDLNHCQRGRVVHAMAKEEPQ
jgi:hypothetical protein